MTDFVALSRAARELPGPDTHERLWSAWFALPLWHFIKARSPAGWMPYSDFVNGVRCVLAFSDAPRADGYVRFAGLRIDPRVVSPVLSLTPESMVQLVPQLRAWGIEALAVDPGSDAFYTPIEGLFAMLQHYRGAAAAPRPIVPVPSPTASVDALLALPAWHVVTTREDPSFPDLADRGTDLVAQVYSSAQAVARLAGSPPTCVMTPRAALALLADIELVHWVRFDGELEVQLIDLALSGRH